MVIQEQYAANVWAVLKRFGYESLPEHLNGSNIHRMENVLTLGIDIHQDFDNLKIWLTTSTVGLGSALLLSIQLISSVVRNQ